MTEPRSTKGEFSAFEIYLQLFIALTHYHVFLSYWCLSVLFPLKTKNRGLIETQRECRPGIVINEDTFLKNPNKRLRDNAASLIEYARYKCVQCIYARVQILPGRKHSTFASQKGYALNCAKLGFTTDLLQNAKRF